MTKHYTPIEKSWILYDVANSAFVLIVITTVMPIFFKDVASVGIDPSISTANWGFANSFSSLLLAVFAPILGTIADYQGYKKRFFVGFLCLGILSTFLLTWIGQGDWLTCLVFFILSRIGFSGANLFYDAFLVDVTDKDRMNLISSAGYGWGYIGSVIPFLVVIGIIIAGMASEQNATIPVTSAKISFVIVGLWWAIFSIPMVKTVKQRFYVHPSATPITDSFVRLITTFREIKHYRPVFLFLIAYFFYIDGVDTIITMATSYGRDIGLGVNMLILAILMIQIVAFPFAIWYGKLADRYSEKTMIYVGIGVYLIITMISYFLPDFSSEKLKIGFFWALAFLVASSQGGIQALSRSLYGKLIPPERSAEFFGFYNIFGKFATILGPFLMGTISRLTGHSRYGILSIVVLFIIGGIILTQVHTKTIGERNESS